MIESLPAQFDARRPYFATASSGLPPRVTVAAMREVLDAWREGDLVASQFDSDVEEARGAFARIVGVAPSAVAIGNQVSPLVGFVAGGLPANAEVLVPAGEYTSVSFPFAARGLRIREAPLATLADHVTASTTMVALSAVQSASGVIADLDAIARAADDVGADVLVDATQAIGWLPLDASRFAFTVCAAYKWLLAPRGAAFLTVGEHARHAPAPLAAGWWAGADRWASLYGLPLRLAEGARGLDVSPAWFSWTGARASLGFVEDAGVARLHRHALAVEDAFCGAADLPARGQAIRSFAADPAVPAILERLGAVATTRDGRLRLAFHANNTPAEAEELGRALRGHISP